MFPLMNGQIQTTKTTNLGLYRGFFDILKYALELKSLINFSYLEVERKIGGKPIDLKILRHVP